jgi:Tol biopolymer transport system component
VFRSAAGQKEPDLLSNGNLDFFVQDVSNDGSRVLYNSVTETSDLWKADISNENQVAIANDVATEFWPEVSPDGKSLAYQAVNQADRPYRGSIRVASMANSTAVLTLSQEGFSPEWSPDGRFVAFFRRSDSGISIWRVQSDGGNAIKLADGAVSPPGYLATPYLKTGIGHLSWSPDGGTLAYSARNDGISNIWLVSADGSNHTMVTANTNPSESFCCSAWASEGGSLIFASEYTQPGPALKRGFRLWLVDIAKPEQKLLIDSTTQFSFIGLSGEQALIAERFDATENTPVAKAIRIVARSLNSGANRVVTTLNNTYFQNIHLSRDGRVIAYVTRVNDLCAVWTVGVDDGKQKKLIEENDPKILISSLAWSPDGRSIVFGKQTRTNMLSMLSK